MMDEYISREAALKKACEGCNREFQNKPCEPTLCDIRSKLSIIPAADVKKVRHGKWIPSLVKYGSSSDHYVAREKCSACGSFERETRKYCPECGAKMDLGE